MINSTKYHMNTNEDPKTSTIFENLLLLPDDIFWGIIRNSTRSNNNDLPKEIGLLKHNEFWPKWNPTGTSNKNYVEPDLFFRFSDYDFIVEAKLSDSAGQDYDEWKREVIAYSNEYSGDNKKVFLLAVGGNNDFNEVNIYYNNYKKCRVLKYKWSELLEQVLKEKENYIKNIKSPNSNFVLRTFNLLEEGFHIMGVNNNKRTNLSSIGNFYSLIKMFNETCDNRQTQKYKVIKTGSSFSEKNYFNFNFKIEFSDKKINNIKLSLQIWFNVEKIILQIDPNESGLEHLIEMIKSLINDFNHFSIKYLKKPYLDEQWYYIEINDTFENDFSEAKSFNEQLTILTAFVDELINNYLNYCESIK